MNLIEEIAKLPFGTTVERAENCALMEQMMGAEICGKYNQKFSPNTLRILTDTEHYVLYLRNGQIKRMDLPFLVVVKP